MCFAPQRHALFRHPNFQKWPKCGVFCTFWLRNVLRATTTWTFSTSQLRKVVRSWCVFYILTSKCASRHNGVQFFISHLARWLRARRFSEPTFRPPEPQIIGKNTVNRDFPTFSRICIFFLLTLSLLWPSLFYSSPLCDSSHLYFSSVHIVGSLTFKLPSVISYHLISYHIISYHGVMLPNSGDFLSSPGCALWWHERVQRVPAWTWPAVSRSTGFAVASFLLDG